ncbi:MAG: S-layer homology domain-containing protein [Candidatus Metalachnospira sp.]|nr:S-layer homology domain-containing protein [Candidatus Metalachnospira sp.]
MFTKLKGKLTAVALTFSLTLAVCPNCAIANENNSVGGISATGFIAENSNGNRYSSLVDAIGEASDGDTVTLLDNAGESADKTITVDKSITIDGDGYTLKGALDITGDDVEIVDLIIENEYTEGKQSSAIHVNGDSGQKVLIKDCEVNKKGANYGIRIGAENAEVTVDNTKITLPDNVAWTQAITLVGANAELNVINESEISAPYYYAIVNFSNEAVINIQDSKVSGWAAVYLKHNSEDINGRGTKVNINNSTLIGECPHEFGISNYFSVVILEGTEDCEVYIDKDSKIISIGNKNGMTLVSAYSLGGNKSSQNNVEIDCVLELRTVDKRNFHYFKNEAAYDSSCDNVFKIGENVVFKQPDGEYVTLKDEDSKIFDVFTNLESAMSIIEFGSDEYNSFTDFDGYTLTLSDDTELSVPDEFKITKSITIDTNGHTLAISDGTEVKLDAPVKLKGNVEGKIVGADGKEIVVSKNPDGTFEYKPVNNDALEDESAAKIGDLYYSTLETAVEKANRNDIVILTKDNDEDIIIKKECKFTLDKNGFRFTGSINAGKGYEVSFDKDGDKITYKITEHKSSSSSVSLSESTVTIKDYKHGNVRVSPRDAQKGDTVKITAVPDEDYCVKSIKVVDNNGDEIKVHDEGNGIYIFTMTASKAVVEVRFEKYNAEKNVDVQSKFIPFTDISSDKWYYEGVKYVYERGIMNGISAHIFDPDTELTRAMVVRILYNIEGNPETGANSFIDVNSNSWYLNAVSWAASNGIASGVGDGRFEPDSSITREQLSVMLYNYSLMKGWDTSRGGMAFQEFTDCESVSDWAANAVKWAVNYGIISGRSQDKLEPRGIATRAEASVMLMNFTKNIK